MSDPFNVDFNIGIFGEGRVGKTCLIKRFVDGGFDEDELSGINAETFEKSINIDKTVVNLTIYDLPGQDTYHSLAKNYMKGLHGVILVYDIITKGSYEKINYWYEQLEKAFKADNLDINKVPFLLIGNKYDLEEKRVIKEEDGLNFVKDKKHMIFYECSAKSGHNVEIAINELAANILKSQKENQKPNEEQIPENKENKETKKKKKCYLF
jgi:small GTP-binding protein